MFDDMFYQTHLGEIFQKSHCLYHEHAMVHLFSSLLLNMGYQKIPSSARGWRRGSRKIIVCLADDFGVNRDDWSLLPDQWFDTNTTIITDNHMPFATDYQILKLPSSYFGVFSYVPADQHWDPSRRFNFSVNRLDSQRQLILLELIKQSGGVDQIIQLDHVNFNARAQGNEHTAEDARRSFVHCWTHLTQLHNTEYADWFSQALTHIPVRNHSFTVEQAQVRAYLNLVIETYAGDASVALSEKIFRALVTPAPWAVLSAKHAVNYLKTLGFDVLDDVVDHAYDNLTQSDTMYGHGKISKFIKLNIQNYHNIKNLDQAKLAVRCQIAATHNQCLLAHLQRQWPADFAQWLPDTIAKLQ
jgi:hypothetical protein